MLLIEHKHESAFPHEKVGSGHETRWEDNVIVLGAFLQSQP